MESDANKKPARTSSILLTIGIAIIGGLAYGFVRTSFKYFFDFIPASHEYAADAALVFFIVIYIISKAVVNWKLNTDDIAHQLYKRVLHILELFLLAGLVLTVIWLVLKYCGALRI